MKENICDDKYAACFSVCDNDDIFFSDCCLKTESVGKMKCKEFIDTDVSKLFEFFKTPCINERFVPGNEICCGSEHCHSRDTIKIVKVNHEICNLKCKHCIVLRSFLPDSCNKLFNIYNNYHNVLNKLKGNNLDILYLTHGGEPLLTERDILFLETLEPTDFKKVVITTNAATLNEDYIKRLKKVNEKVELLISVSIDGISKEVYENIRIGANFETALNNTLMLKKYGLLGVVNFVVQPLNRNEWLKAVDFWNKYEIFCHFLVFRVNVGSDQKDSTEVLEDPLFKEMKKKYPKNFRCAALV